MHTPTRSMTHHALPPSIPCAQAVEAKEGLEIQNESVTLASVSYQAFFRGFPKLAGTHSRELVSAEQSCVKSGMPFLEVVNIMVSIMSAFASVV